MNICFVRSLVLVWLERFCFFLFTLVFALFFCDVLFWSVGNYKTLLYLSVLFGIFTLFFRKNREHVPLIGRDEFLVLSCVSLTVILSLVFVSTAYVRKDYVQHGLYFLLIVLFFWYWLESSPPQVKLLAFKILLFVVSLFALYQWYGVIFVNEKLGFFKNPHYLANFCILASMILAAGIFRFKGSLPRLFIGLILVVVFYLLLKTQSRPAWLSVFFILSICLMSFVRGPKLILGGGVLLILPLALYVVFPALFGERLMQLILHITTEERVEIWADSLAFLSEMPLNHLVFGYGPGSSQSILVEYVEKMHPGIEFPHNFFIELVIELGLLGLALWCFAFLVFFKLMFESSKGGRPYCDYSVIVFAGAASLFVFSFLVFPFYSRDVVLFQAPLWAVAFWLKEADSA